MITPKFKVGDVLKLLLDDSGLVKLHVVEVHTNTCVADVAQVFYHCRVYTKQYKDAPPSLTTKYILFNEMELEVWREAGTLPG